MPGDHISPSQQKESFVQRARPVQMGGTYRLRKDSGTLAGLGAVDQVAHLLWRQVRADDAQLPLDPRALLRAMFPLRLGVPVNHLLEPPLDKPDLLLSDIDVLQRELGQPRRDQDS